MQIPKDNRSSYDIDTESNVVKSRLKTTLGTKKCAVDGCDNMILNRKNKKYCSDERCVKIRNNIRKEQSKGKPRAKHLYTPDINVIIPAGTKPLMGKVLTIQCGARSRKGRCKNIITVPYTVSRSHYPRYCEEHRNEFRRKRWESQ